MTRAIAHSSAGTSPVVRTRRVTSSRPRSGETGKRFDWARARASSPRSSAQTGGSGYPLRVRGRRRTRTGGETPPVLCVASQATPRAALSGFYLATASTAAAAIVAPRALLFRRPRRCVLRPLDQLLRLDEAAVLVLRDQLEADPAARLVHFLDDAVDDVAARHDVLDVSNPARADVRHVEE